MYFISVKSFTEHTNPLISIRVFCNHDKDGSLVGIISTLPLLISDALLAYLFEEVGPLLVFYPT